MNMFVTVRYGDRKSRIFNANCKNDILLHHIKSSCDCSIDDIIDVSDERGTVKNLRNNLNDYGTDYLMKRESLILLKVERLKLGEDQEKVKFVPLLDGLKGNREFSDALNPKEESSSSSTSTPQSRPRRRSSIVEFNLDDLKNGSQKRKSNGSLSARKSMQRRSTTKTLLKSK